MGIFLRHIGNPVLTGPGRIALNISGRQADGPGQDGEAAGKRGAVASLFRKQKPGNEVPGSGRFSLIQRVLVMCGKVSGKGQGPVKICPGI